MRLFITFEGGEGSGKSTQARMLYRRLSRLGVPALLTREPGGTPLGNSLRRILRFGPDAISPEAELFLFLASRAQLVREVVRPALGRGEVVLCDRFADSTIVYQGFGRGLSPELLHSLNESATQGLRPKLTILLDVSIEEARRRLSRKVKDRIEQELDGGPGKAAFHQRVRQGYLALARGEPKRWLVIDATLPKRDIADKIWERVEPLLSR